MLAAIGDLVEDIVIRVADPVHVASDTEATIVRRRGGSAANVSATAARLGHAARFLGRVGDDAIGAALAAELGAAGVDVAHVQHAGRTGTIVVLVDASGERTMLTDRAACRDLDRPQRSWLDTVATLHVPMYSVVDDPLAATTRTVLGWAHETGVTVSVDVSSVALVDRFGRRSVLDLLGELRPAVVFANEAEAGALALDGPVGTAITVVKRGPEPVTVHTHETSIDVPATPIERGADTTGAGDAFAAGFLTADWWADAGEAARAGHAAAARTLVGDRGRLPSR